MTTGRLAPTPSGYLHVGNARSFLLAWLWARAEGGRVILRIEDIDLPRCKPEFRDAMYRDLEWLGLDWDERVIQSDRLGVYRERLDALAAAGLAYPCTCSRKDIEQASSAPHGDEGPIYPGACRDRWRDAEHAKAESGREPAWRFRWDGQPMRFTDKIQGEVEANPEALGDFVLWRRDRLPGYQLAVTVDDAAQGVTQVLRGRDLLTSTARQLALYAALGAPPPRQWAHVPLLRDETGRRMAKRYGDLSLKNLREIGADPRALVGFLAFSAGLLPHAEALAPSELVSEFRISRPANTDFVLLPEHLPLFRK